MISGVIEYIGGHCKEITSLDEIVEQFYISKSYLCRLFKEHTGISVVKYIHLLKIQSACEELQKTNRSVEEIALQCGFHTSVYFCRVFKKITGLTPSQYRGQSLWIKRHTDNQTAEVLLVVIHFGRGSFLLSLLFPDLFCQYHFVYFPDCNFSPKLNFMTQKPLCAEHRGVLQLKTKLIYWLRKQRRNQQFCRLHG